jgi:hypothetical protein
MRLPPVGYANDIERTKNLIQNPPNPTSIDSMLFTSDPQPQS